MADDLFMRRVYVASPLAAGTPAGVRANAERARRLCLLAMKLEGVAAFAPHAFYTSFLDDAESDERELGKQAGMCWLESADEVWIWNRAGVSGGMKEEIEVANGLGIPVIVNPACFDGVDG